MDVLKKHKGYRFYSSSLLLIYDAKFFDSLSDEAKIKQDKESL